MAEFNVEEERVEEVVKSFITKINFIHGMEDEKRKYHDIERAYRIKGV